MLRKVSSSILRSNSRQLRRLRFLEQSHGRQTLVSDMNGTVMACRNFSNFDVFKDKFTGLLKRGTEKTAEVVKKQTDSAREALEVQAKKASETLCKEGHKAFEKGSSKAADAFAKTSAVAGDALRSTSQTVGEKIRTVAQSATQASVQAAAQGRQAITSKSKEAASATSERIRNSSVRFLVNAQDFGRKAARWFFWWSLAAIAVYGIATAIPTALIRYSLTRGGTGSSSSSKEISSKQTSLAGDSTTSSSATDQGGWIQKLLSKTTSPAVDPTVQQQNRGFWSWGSSSSGKED